MNKITMSPRRLWLLIKRDISIGYRGTLIAAAAVGGFVLVFSLLSAVNSRNDPYYYGMYGALLFLGGYIVTSLAFREVHREENGTFYLTLPGSALEKYVSKLLVSSVGYVLVSMIFMSAVAALSEGVAQLIFGGGHAFFNPFQKEVLLAAAVYLVTQSVFLMGSIYFKKLAFIKTYLALSILAIALAAVVGFFTWVLYSDFFEQGRVRPGIELHFNQLGESGVLESTLSSAARGFVTVVKILFWALLAPLCWVIGYFRLSEAEV